MGHSKPYPTFEEVIAKEIVVRRKIHKLIFLITSHFFIFLIGIALGRAFNGS